MGYAVLKGDYMRGGYAASRGDPFLGGLGKLLGSGLKAATGLIRKAAPVALSVFPGGGTLAKLAKGAGGVIKGLGRSKAARAAAGIGVGVGASYVGTKLAEGGFGGGGGRSKRMNPANVKALRRAIRRMEGFQKLAKSTGCLPKPARRSRSSVCRTCK